MSEHKVSQDELKTEFSNEDLYFKKLDEERIAAQKRKEEKVMVCPRDGHALELVDIDHVQVDRCPHCMGIWLDAHELQAFRHAGEKPGILKTIFGSLIPERRGD